MAVFFTTLSAAELTWQNPTDGEALQPSVDLKVSSDASPGTVKFWYRQSRNNDWNKVGEADSTSGDGNYTITNFDKSDDTYYLKVNATSSNSEKSISFDLDGVKPNSPDSKSPTGDISDKSPKVSLDASDDISGVDYTYINVTYSGDNNEESTKGTSLSLDDLDNEQYTVDYKIVDNAGNSRSGGWNFTVDTSYDGDSDPNSLSWDPEPEDNIFVTKDGETIDLTVKIESSSGDVNEDADRLECYDGDTDNSDNMIDSDSFDEADEDDTLEATCKFETDADLLEDEELNLNLKFLDEAGNSATSNEDSYIFDMSEPILSLDEKEVTKFNSNFELSYSANDESGIKKLEYFFEEETDEGGGTKVEVDSDGESVNSSFEVDPSELDSGSQTVYVRAMDEADRWSTTDTFDFEYLPDANPEISVSAPNSLEATAGKESSFEITVTNSGELKVNAVEINVSGLVSQTKSLGEISIEDKKTFEVSFTPKESQIGNSRIKVGSSRFDVSETVNVRIKASSTQKSRIESNLTHYEFELEDIKANSTELESKVGEELEKKLNSSVSKFEKRVQDARNAVEEGKYYKAEAILQGIDRKYESAESTLSEVSKTYEERKSRQIMIAVAFLMVLAIAGGGFYAHREGYLGDLEMDMGVDTSVITDTLDNVRSNEDDEDEDEEFEWNGFS